MKKQALQGVIGLLLAGAVSAAEGENMIGRQSHNEGVRAVKAPAKVSIDGKLDEWDLSGQIWTFADVAVRERFSVKSAAMWDQDFLYLGYLWKDPMPLNSMVDPAFNPDKGWVADSLQLRVLAGGQTSWITTWFFAGKQVPVFHVAYWQDERNNKNGLDETLLVGKPGTPVLGNGVEMAYQKLEDGSGFVQEVKIAWRVIYKKDHIARAGESVKMGMEFLWGDPTGKTWPIHRYADNLAEGETSREFFWTAKKAWGPITLLDKNNIETRRYIVGGSKPTGTIKVQARVPANAASFSLVIEDQTGKRIRNLVGGVSPEDYAVKTEGGQRTVEVDWDGLDDQGKMVAPGSYSVRGLTHKGLGAEYEMTFYNPGTPAWKTTDGSGAWGADHASPEFISRAGDWMIIAWGFAEGGHGIIGIGPDGQKKWGEKRGVASLASEEDYLYAIPNTWHTKQQTLMRMRVKDGAYAPFMKAGKEREFELPFEEILGKEGLAKVTALAAAKGMIAVALEDGGIALLDAESAEVRKRLTVDGPVQALAFGRDGKQVFALIDGKVSVVDVNSGQQRQVPLPGVGKAVAMNVDNDGHILVVDMGPDQQVKAFSPAGKLLYTCGKKGGRPVRGRFIAEAMSHVSSVAADRNGAVWTTENWDFPRRVSVWGKDGALIRDYVGNTAYSGSGTFLHDSKPGIGYVGSNQIALNSQERTWSVDEILWVPDAARGEQFGMDSGSHAQGHVFTSKASGVEREYMFRPYYRGWSGLVVFMKRDDGWKPVSALTTAVTLAGKVGHHAEVLQKPQGEFADLHPWDAIVWNDANKNGIAERAECVIVKANVPDNPRQHINKKIALPIDASGWGCRMDPGDLSFIVGGGVKYTPVSFDEDGAPVYSKDGMTRLAFTSGREYVPVPGENMVTVLGGNLLAGIDKENGDLQWRYPNPYNSVHGSHRATMPKPGLVIGPLKNAGIATDCGEAKGVFLLRGNLGQDFLLTTDGLYVASMFQDGRLPGMTLPAKEEALLGMPMEMFSQGGEPFNGWFGRQDDGVVRLTSGMPGQACMVLRIKGLETIRRFDAPDLKVDQAALTKADKANQARAIAAAKPKEYAITASEQAPDRKAWDKIKAVEIERIGQPVTGEVKLAYSASHLYARFMVKDPSPWKNEGKDFTRLFKTGDAVDIKLSPSSNSGKNPVEGDLRVVIGDYNKKPVAVLMKPFDKAAPKSDNKNYHSPVGDKFFQKVALIPEAKIKLRKGGAWYQIEASIPWAALGLSPEAGMKMRADFGFILSDAAGTINTARVYWSNKNTNLVNDMPIEAWFEPASWGEVEFE